MEFDSKTAQFTKTESYKSKIRQTKFEDKFLVAVRVTSCYQEGVKTDCSKDKHETTNFRETLEKCIEQELVSLGDVKIVENDIKEAWAYFIQIVFNIVYRERKNEQHLPVVEVTISFYETGGLLGFYTPVSKPSLEQLDEFCKDFVIDFNHQYLEPERKNEAH